MVGIQLFDGLGVFESDHEGNSISPTELPHPSDLTKWDVYKYGDDKDVFILPMPLAGVSEIITLKQSVGPRFLLCGIRFQYHNGDAIALGIEGAETARVSLGLNAVISSVSTFDFYVTSLREGDNRALEFFLEGEEIPVRIGRPACMPEEQDTSRYEKREYRINGSARHSSSLFLFDRLLTFSQASLYWIVGDGVDRFSLDCRDVRGYQPAPEFQSEVEVTTTFYPPDLPDVLRTEEE